MRIAIAADHHGLHLKKQLLAALTAAGHRLDDRGADINEAETVDYPQLCYDVGRLVVTGAVDRGIIIGGSGQGEHIACNKMRGIRAGLCHDAFSTEISRTHNDANVLIIGAKVTPASVAGQLVDAWLAAKFLGGRHRHRLDQIAAIERGERPG
ncbi:MAG TPA: RpiB/LacA/LacB family sugar-phosphate isomerase [Micromonosporaceae bacterium]|jgi:ribose 5-phosphate isomerase B